MLSSKKVKKNDSYHHNQPSKIGGGIFDITKYILSIMVLAIHTNFISPHLYPWLRMAVPLFFIMSSYFFFSNVIIVANKQAYLKKFIYRNLKLYTFWFIVLLPITLFVKQYFQHGFLIGCASIIYDFLFQETFRASWFIMALIIAMSIVFYMRSHKFLSWYMALLCYAICCASSNYGVFFHVDEVFKANSIITYNIYLSFPVAFVWVLIGKWFAEHDLRINTMRLVYAIAVFSVIFIVEHQVVNYYNLSLATDCYISLIMLCPTLFALLLKVKQTIPNNLTLRKYSIIIYCVHYSLATISVRLFYQLHIEDYHGTLLFISTFIISNLAALAIISLQKRKYFEWLKYAY